MISAPAALAAFSATDLVCPVAEKYMISVFFFLVVTVIVHLYLFFPLFAVIVVFPGFFAVILPFFTVATAFFEDDHFTFLAFFSFRAFFSF